VLATKATQRNTRKPCGPASAASHDAQRLVASIAGAPVVDGIGAAILSGDRRVDFVAERYAE
jgi:hypothetical protein